jgi:hypothetical protein
MRSRENEEVGVLVPLRNRVDPSGEIHAVEARGMFMGNRGVIHDPDTRTLLKRRWATKAWIICECEFKDHKRAVMGRNTRSGNAGWTELFFLDEVTALAAGHRPCFYCRREKAKEYAECFGKAFAIARPTVAQIDGRLHVERLASGGQVVGLTDSDLAALPDGAMVLQGKRAFAKKGEKMREWSFSGYRGHSDYNSLRGNDVRLCTPTTTRLVLKAGYRPVWHSSA